MIMDTGLNHSNMLQPVGVGVSMGVVDVHGNSGDIDSLLSSSDPADHVSGSGSGLASGNHGGNGNSSGNSSGNGDGKLRRLLEPYERHRAHDLRAECYRRGIRPIKKGPNANDNKNGYIVLLRKYDATVSNGGFTPEERTSLSSQHGAGAGGGSGSGAGGDDDDVDDGDSDSNQLASLTKKRKLPSPPHVQQQQQQHQQQQQQHMHPSQQQQHLQPSGVSAAAVAAAAAANDLAGFYDTTQTTSLVPVLPMQYPSLVSKPPSVAAPSAATASGAAATTSDLEILSGIANTYTTQVGNAGPHGSGNGHGGMHGLGGGGVDGGMFCGNCRTVVTDQLMESIRLGRNKMQMLEFQRLTDQRDRDTIHLKEIVTVLRDLRQTLRDAQHENRLTHELLVELEDDIAFFQTLKERTKDRMRKEMQEARDKPINAGNVGTT